MKLIEFKKSNIIGKKYMVVIENEGKTKTIHFGASGYEDYTTSKDDERKQRYLDRHRAREDWTNPLTAGFWSRWILWNKKTIDESLTDTRRRFAL
jgi:hypothetical protein